MYHQCGISLFRHHITTVFYYIVYAAMNMNTIGNFVDISWAIRKPIFVSKISFSKTLNVLVQSNIISLFPHIWFSSKFNLLQTKKKIKCVYLFRILQKEYGWVRIDIEDLIRKQWSLMSLQCFQSIEKLKLERNSSITLTIVSKQIANVWNIT